MLQSWDDAKAEPARMGERTSVKLHENGARGAEAAIWSKRVVEGNGIETAERHE